MAIFKKGKMYDRQNIHYVLGGTKKTNLALKNQGVVAAFAWKPNPEMPTFILIHGDGRSLTAAEKFLRQKTPVPTFRKARNYLYEYLGMYDAIDLDRNPDNLDYYTQGLPLPDEVPVTGILFLAASEEEFIFDGQENIPLGEVRTSHGMTWTCTDLSGDTPGEWLVTWESTCPVCGIPVSAEKPYRFDKKNEFYLPYGCPEHHLARRQELIKPRKPKVKKAPKKTIPVKPVDDGLALIAEGLGLTCQDNRPKGGAFWIRTDDSDERINFLLKSKGFRYKERKGWWKQ